MKANSTTQRWFLYVLSESPRCDFILCSPKNNSQQRKSWRTAGR